MKDMTYIMFKMGKDTYHVTDDMWREVFGLSILSWHATLSDHSYHLSFDMKSYLNSCLKAPRPDHSMDILSTRSLKIIPCILHWIVTHVLYPRKLGNSRLDQDELHLMYLLQNKMFICWPNYFVTQMFSIRECNQRFSLCYSSMIAKFLLHFGIDMENLHNISPDQDQEFNISIMKHIGYHWDGDLKIYYYRMKGSGKIVYNYDDLVEFGIDELYVEE